MSLKNVSWISSTKLPCACNEPANVILCVTPSKVLGRSCSIETANPTYLGTVSTVEAEIIDYSTFNTSNGKGYRYVFEYDTDDLVADTLITREDISGVICESCITTWVRELVGQEVRIYSENGLTKLVNQYGCEYILPVGDGASFASRHLVTSAAHGFGDAGDLVLLTGINALAQGDALVNTADYVALIVDANTYYILGPGFQNIYGHGYDLGVWYSLSPSAPGAAVQSYTLTQDDIIQNAFIAIDANTILVDLQEAIEARYIPEAATINLTAHGFVVGERISLVGGVWQPGIAGEMAYFVKEVLDANTFVISLTWAGIVPGLAAGQTYALNPATPGQLIDLDLLNTASDPITRVGFAPKTNYLLGFMEYPVIRGVGSLPDVIAPIVSAAVVPAAGTTLIITFTESVLPILSVTGFTVEADAVPVTVSSASRTAVNQITLVLATTITPGQVVTIDYSPGNVTDSSGNALGVISGGAVTNNASTGGALFFDEDIAGGFLNEVYSELFGGGAPEVAFINAPGVAPLGDWYLTYTKAASVGADDFQTFIASDIISVPVACLEFEQYVGFIDIVPGITEIFSFYEDDGLGAQDGLKIRIGVSGGSWQTRVWNNADGGSPIDVFDSPAGASPVVNKWYKITGSMKMSSATGVADGELNYIIQPLQGTIASTTGADDGTPITVNNTTIITHNSVAPGLFGGMRVTGGYIQKSVTASNPWGIAFGGLKANVCP